MDQIGEERMAADFASSVQVGNPSEVQAGDHQGIGQLIQRRQDPSCIDAAGNSQANQDEPQGGVASIDSGVELPVLPEHGSPSGAQVHLDAAGDSISNTPAATYLRDQPNIQQTLDNIAVQPDLARDPLRGGVNYGSLADLKNFAEKQDEIRKQGLTLPGQDGILLKGEKLHINNNNYRENAEFDKLVPPLGEGSYGEVSIIRDKRTKQDAVAKYIKLKDFQVNEAVNWCHLTDRSPFIVRFLGLIRTDVTIMFLSEYNPGFRTLESFREGRNFRIDQMQALGLMDQLFQALAYMHGLKIIHKDIHGNNILVSPSLDRVRLRLIDFGESKRITGREQDVRDDEYYDVWCAIFVYIRLLGGCTSSLDYESRTNSQQVKLPSNIDERLRHFIQHVINRRLKAFEVVDLIGKIGRELYSVYVTGPPTDDYVPPDMGDGL
ncbi:mitogen-activated protein kinase kinase kinase 14-like [Acanthaster planci]|uniref:Mitogen-activated protein kinase kinase kinase 14-like n=1 Tax=Acanthaster planci TaxID=133434 RepID=A0A8B7XSZ3_ACAPL|nr:mitogen-activated protein kinase kinase kinase 14-like [Acanthaster planci]